MRIINAMLGRGLGGIEQAIVDYSEALALAGHEVHAVIHPKSEMRKVLEKKKITVHTLSQFAAWDFTAMRKLRKLVDTIDPDISIAHGNRAVSFLNRAAKSRKVIGVTHNYKMKCDHLTAVFCPTHDLMRYATQAGVPGSDIYFIPNMVRLANAYKEHPLHSPPVIGGMGRFVAKKGFDVFIEALALLKLRNLDFKAILAGSGEEEEALKKLAAAKGLNDRLSFAGWVENKKVFFQNIDMFCLPSHHEPFGIVLLEAMAEGVAVVSTKSEGPSEIIHHNIDGILLPKADAVALADALQSLLADKTKALALAKAAYAMIKKQYDLPVISEKLDLAVKSVVQR